MMHLKKHLRLNNTLWLYLVLGGLFAVLPLLASRTEKPAPITLALLQRFDPVGVFARDLKELFDHLGWRNAAVAGCSMGGCVAQAFAGELRLCTRHRVQGLFDGTVANRVHGALETLAVGATDEVVELVLLVRAEHAGLDPLRERARPIVE